MPARVQTFAKAAAEVTADRIAREMERRVARRTGKTMHGITVAESRDQTGWVVYVGDGRQHIAAFLEYGTRYMTRQDFFWPSAQIEQGAHDRRTREAIQEAIDTAGLGDA
jgi:HK97 gp10 family phage protein